MLPYHNVSNDVIRKGFALMALVWLVMFTISFAAVSVGEFDRAIDERASESAQPANHTVIGFLPYWSIGQTDLDDYQNNITTLTYFGLTLNADGTIYRQSYRGVMDSGWSTLNSAHTAALLAQARKQNFNLSLLVSLMKDKQIRTLIANPQLHGKTLVNEVAPIMRAHGFSDLNLDFESFSAASSEDQQQFSDFTQAVKQELTAQNLGTLTVEITPISLAHDQLIDPAAVGSIVDHIVLMAYDYHYAGSPEAGPVAPLGGAGVAGGLNVGVSINQAEDVIDPKKLILGIPLYGYDWMTKSASLTSRVIRGSGQAASVKEIESRIDECENGCLMGREPDSQSPYLVYKQPGRRYYHTIFYEDADLIAQKLDLIQAWGGAAVWALGYEGKDLLEPLVTYKNQVITNSGNNLALLNCANQTISSESRLKRVC